MKLFHFVLWRIVVNVEIKNGEQNKSEWGGRRRRRKQQARWETNLIFIAVCYAVAHNRRENWSIKKGYLNVIYDRGIKIRKCNLSSSTSLLLRPFYLFCFSARLCKIYFIKRYIGIPHDYILPVKHSLDVSSAPLVSSLDEKKRKILCKYILMFTGMFTQEG